MLDVLCNLCGESCGLAGGPEPGGEPIDQGGLIRQAVFGGYNSTPGNGAGALDDTMRYRFSLCEFCLDWLFTNSKIPPEVSDYGGEPAVWKSAEERVLNDPWRQEHKDGFLKEKARRDQARMGNWARRKSG